MEIFNLTLKQMLMMFTLITVGFVLRKKNIIPDGSDTAMAKLETYVFVPALSISNQLTQCTVQSFKESYSLILYGFFIALCAIGVAFVLSKPVAGKKSDDYIKNIYKYALTFGNYGFMGNFIVLGVWGEEFFYRYLMFTFGVSLLCYSWGVYTIIPKDKNAGLAASLKKGLLTPPLIGLVLGMILGLLGAKDYIPGFVLTALDNAGKCQGPVAMLLVGVVIGGFDIKKLFNDKSVYVATFLRLILIPAVMMLILKAIGTSKEFMIITLIAFATPLGLNTVVYPAAYGGDTKPGASMAIISHTLSVITIPLMYLLFVEVL